MQFRGIAIRQAPQPCCQRERDSAGLVDLPRMDRATVRADPTRSYSECGGCEGAQREFAAEVARLAVKARPRCTFDPAIAV